MDFAGGKVSRCAGTTREAGKYRYCGNRAVIELLHTANAAANDFDIFLRSVPPRR